MTLFEVPPGITEKQWQRALLNGLIEHGYWTNHNQPTKAGNRWVTSGSPGFPDILATGPLGFIVIECKGFRTPIEATQILALEAFAQGGAHAWILRPNSVDWHTVAQWIEDPTFAPKRFGWTPEQYTKALNQADAIHHTRPRRS